MLPLILGLVHFGVDASSNFLVARLLRTSAAPDLIALLVIYNFLAFALQPLVGWLTDHWHSPRAVMASGLLIAGAAMVFHDTGMAALVLTGLGNALFHVGAGVIASAATPERATGPGLFIGPGAIGVVVGAAAGRGWPEAFWPLTLFLLAFAPISVLLPSPPGKTSRREARPAASDRASAVLILLLLAIAGRAFLGARVGAQIAHHSGWVLPVAIAACAGKCLGGVLADRVGWKRCAMVLLVLSSLLLLGEARGAVAVLAGVACFQGVTSITLAALYCVLPTRMALAFGLACLALFVGVLPALLRVDLGPVERAPLSSLLALFTALAVWRALSWLDVPAKTGSIAGSTARVADS